MYRFTLLFGLFASLFSLVFFVSCTTPERDRDGDNGGDPACAGLSCGDSCSTCAPGEACPAVEQYCDVDGQCTSNIGELRCDEPGGACAGRACGDVCSTCIDGAGCDAVAQFCDIDGRCVADSSNLRCDDVPDPCAGKTCGETCSTCTGRAPVPGGGGGACAAEYCNLDGVCQVGEPMCSTDQPCTSDSDCPLGDYCNTCAGSSCPGCDDCVARCTASRCPTETAGCDLPRPPCEPDRTTSVYLNGCWECVDLQTCEPSSVDTSCDDGQPTVCNGLRPTCEPGSIGAAINGCFECVNPATCLPWGEPGCETGDDCPSGVCDDCATSSCFGCEDCVAACR